MPLLPERFGAYLLHERIGRGGMAEVWRATRAAEADGVADTTAYALKRLFPGLDVHSPAVAPFVPMMADEAALLGQLDHPAIVQRVDHGLVGERPFTVLELVDGPDLFGLLQTLHARGRTMPAPLAAYVIAQVCDALHHAHSRCGPDGQPLGLIHRDVSPQNVLCSWQGEVKLTDFGVARATSREAVTDAGLVKGKVYYMAPEQLLGLQLDGRADQFAAGILLYECLTAEPLYKAAAPKLLHQQVAEAQYRWPDDPQQRLPAPLQAVADRALQRRPANRFADCAEMATALRDAATAVAPTVNATVFGAWLRQLYGHTDKAPQAQAGADEVTQAIDAAVLQARLRPPPQPAPAPRPTTPRPVSTVAALPTQAATAVKPADSAQPDVVALARDKPNTAAAPLPARPSAPEKPAHALDAPASAAMLAATVAVWALATLAVLWAASVSVSGK